jgi:hypothetical protein
VQQQKSPPRFPFLWQATPLQRAEKSLVQALVLQPNNGAAALLLGVVYHRQAAVAPTQASTYLQQRDRYLRIAAEQGLPMQQSLETRQPQPFQAFDVDDEILLLEYLDIWGTGQVDDLLFVYRSTKLRALVFAVVITEGQRFPLTTDFLTGSLTQATRLEEVMVHPQPSGRPLLSVRVSHHQTHLEERFIWNNNGFVYLGQHPQSR